MAAKLAARSVFRKATAVTESTRNSLPGVEAVPAEPEQARAERHQRDRVRLLVLHPALADEQHRGQRRDPRDVVHDDAAGEVEHAPLRQPAAAPDHVDEREVDAEQPRRQEEHVGLERHAVREGAGDQRRRDDREHHLVGAEDDHRDRRIDRRRHVERDAAQERPVEIADDAAEVGAVLERAAEAHREAADPPEHRRPPHRHEALDHDREHVLAADQPAIEERQAGRHQHDEAAAEQHEAGVARVERQVLHQHSLQRGPCGSAVKKPA